MNLLESLACWGRIPKPRKEREPRSKASQEQALAKAQAKRRKRRERNSRNGARCYYEGPHVTGTGVYTLRFKAYRHNQGITIEKHGEGNLPPIACRYSVGEPLNPLALEDEYGELLSKHIIIVLALMGVCA